MVNHKQNLKFSSMHRGEQVYNTDLLTTARSAHESQVVEPGNLVLEARRGIAQFGGAVFVVSSC